VISTVFIVRCLDVGVRRTLAPGGIPRPVKQREYW